MIGKIIRQERINKNLSATEFAKLIGINNGFLTHIEKEDRKPSRKVLARICKELNLSYDFMLPLLENSVSENSAKYDVSNYIPTNKILYATELSLVDCPALSETASFVTKMLDNSMEPTISKDSFLYVKYTSLIQNGDTCIVVFNDTLLVRNLFIDNNVIILRSVNKSFKDITVNTKKDYLDIIGKIILY